MSRYMVFLCVGLWAVRAVAAEVALLPVEDGGWNGGDAAYSRVLDSGGRLWVFGDSLVGKVSGGQREDFAMYRNAVGIEAADGSVRYYWGDGDEQGIFRNERKDEWYWPADFLVLRGKGYFFMRRMRIEDPDDILGFRVVGTDLAVVGDITAPPDDWNIQYIPIAHHHIALGVAAAEKDGYVYLLANNDDDHAFHIARIAEKSLREGVFALTYYDPRRKEWRGSEPMRPALEPGSPEASLAWDAGKEEWRLVYTRQGLTPDIVMRTSRDLLSGWGEERVLYRCPEMGPEKPDYVCYAGKEVYGSPELRITYSVNSLKIEDLQTDADIYIPRVVTP